MPRTRSQEVALRNESIVEMAGSHPRRVVAETFGLSEARISQILLEHSEETSGEASRAMQAVRIEFLLDKLFELLRQPRQVKVAPSGKPVYEPDPADPTGKTPDFTRPIYDDTAVVELTKAAIGAMERQAKLGALDLPRLKQKDESTEFAEAWAWANQQAARAKELAERLSAYENPDYAVSEVVAEDPSGES